MVKPKQRQKVAIPKSKDDSLSDINSGRDESWVIVKKQRVSILIPPLPRANKMTVPKPRPDNLQLMPVKVAVNSKSTIPVEVSNPIPSVEELKKVASVATIIGPNLSAKSPRKQNPPRLNVRTESGIPNVLNIVKTIKQPRLVHYQGRVVLNQSLRALLLEKKLQKAGGLSRWVASIGLGQFMKIFRGNISKFQLVNLTMKKLKDMGADPVGPRRKLMHAIDCICQPYCFEAS